MYTYKQLIAARTKANKAHTKAASAWRRARQAKGIARAERLSEEAKEASDFAYTIAAERRAAGLLA